MRTPLAILIFISAAAAAFAQQDGEFVDLDDAANPTTMKSRVALDFESDLFYNESKFYSARLGYYYGLGNGKHLFGLAVPFLHNVFNGDYGGFENTTGIGDIHMLYMGAPYYKKGVIGVERVSAYLEVTAPTGQSRLGRGAGTWIYNPGVMCRTGLRPV
ncbi:MAG: hypothetical protein HC859_05260 [Bacteroidia bacterium]|nr:hypothetical protein [Bacteroidia bacterium]